MEIGEIIKIRRLALGITVENVAEKIGKSRATVYRYENGDIENMPLSVIKPLAELLQITPALFFDADAFNKLELELLQDFRLLEADDKQEICDFIKLKLHRLQGIRNFSNEHRQSFK